MYHSYNTVHLGFTNNDDIAVSETRCGGPRSQCTMSSCNEEVSVVIMLGHPGDFLC